MVTRSFIITVEKEIVHNLTIWLDRWQDRNIMLF